MERDSAEAGRYMVPSVVAPVAKQLAAMEAMTLTMARVNGEEVVEENACLWTPVSSDRTTRSKLVNGKSEVSLVVKGSAILPQSKESTGVLPPPPMTDEERSKRWV